VRKFLEEEWVWGEEGGGEGEEGGGEEGRSLLGDGIAEVCIVLYYR
jgi:hypothetical protein